MAQSCDPNDLIKAASCFRCVPAGFLDALRTYLLCQWANSAASPCGTPSGVIWIYGSSGTNIGASSVYVATADPNVWHSLSSLSPPRYPTMVHDVAGIYFPNVPGDWVIIDGNLATLDYVTAANWPCGPWTSGPGVDDPPPSGKYIPSSHILLDPYGAPVLDNNGNFIYLP